MTHINRATQLRVLQILADAYPDSMSSHALAEKLDLLQHATHKLDANLKYLEQHGLIDVHWIHEIGKPAPRSTSVCVCAKGLDLLADDGGLSAILGTVTIKFHEDTLRALIESRIASSDLAPADKRRWTDALRELPADSIKHLSTKLIDLALDKAPGALPLLAKAIGLG